MLLRISWLQGNAYLKAWKSNLRLILVRVYRKNKKNLPPHQISILVFVQFTG